MDERGQKRTSKWDLIGGKRNFEDNGRENVRDEDNRASSNEYKSYSGRHSSVHAADDNTKYPTTKDVRSKYEPDVSIRDHASGNQGTWRNNSFDRDNRGLSEAGTNWDDDESRREREHARSPKSSWQRPVRSRSRGKSRSRSRSRSPVGVYRHESDMNDRRRGRPEVPVQTCRDFTSGRCRRGSHCPFLHPSTQNFEDRRYDYESREESHRGGKYSHYNASDGQYNDSIRDASESRRAYNRDSRGASFNHGTEREHRRSADIPCTFFAAGNCRNGKYCRFSHQILTPRNSGERAHDERWVKNHSPEKFVQLDHGTKFSDMVDQRDERWRKNHCLEKIGQDDPGTEFSDTVDPRNERRKRNHSPEKMGLVDRSSPTEYRKDGRRTNISPGRDSQNDRGMAFCETADPHVAGQGKESKSKVDSSSMNLRSANNMEADYAAHGGPPAMDKLVNVEAGQPSQWKSGYDNNNSTFESKGVVDWIGDKMSPEWNPKVAAARTIAKEEPAYAIQTSDSVSHTSQKESHYMHNVPSEMPNKAENSNSQQSFNPINEVPGGFHYPNNVGSHVATNFSSSFLPGNLAQSSTQDVLVGGPGNSNAAGQGQFLRTPNFLGNEDASAIRTSTANFDIYSVKPNCEDPKTSDASIGAALASAVVSQGHLTDISASLAHFLGKGQHLPQLYNAINPPNAVSSLDISNRNVSPFPVESVQPYPPNGSKEPYQTVFENAGEMRPYTYIEHTQQHPNPGMLRTSEEVKEKTPAAEQNASEAYKNGRMEMNLGHKPEMDSKLIQVESLKGKDKQAELREGSPLENLGGEVKVDGGKKVKETKALRDFKHALVNFVKELLKPAWKDGQIDKEGYKTIVKKAVDKVTGAIQETNIPQTPEKVEHYLSASKPKLTKLVQAYVDRNPKKQA